VEDARRPTEDRRRVAPGLDAVAGGLDDREPDRRLADEPREQPDRVGAATDAGDGEVRQPAFHGEELRGGLVADPSLEVADDRRVRMGAHRRTEDVVRGLDVRDPVTHRFVDRVLQRRRPGRDRADLGAQGAHAQDVRALALDVLGAHVDDARQVEERARGRRRHAVLAGTGLGDDPGLAEAAGQQGLAERVVDLVGARVGEVLALEIEAQLGDPAGPTATGSSAWPAAREPHGLVSHGPGQAIGTVERRRAPSEMLEQVA